MTFKNQIDQILEQTDTTNQCQKDLLIETCLGLKSPQFLVTFEC